MPQEGRRPDSEDDEPSWPHDAIEVGYILDAWGVKGWFKVVPHANDPQALFSSRRWFLQPAVARHGGALAAAKTAGAPLPRLLKITQAKEHGGDGVVAAAQDIEDRARAETLRGARIFVSRASFPTAADDEYYWVDLIGLHVYNREGLDLGEVGDLIDTGAHSVLQIHTGLAKPAQRLIPFVAAYVDRVDVTAGRIEVDWNAAWDAPDDESLP